MRGVPVKCVRNTVAYNRGLQKRGQAPISPHVRNWLPVPAFARQSHIAGCFRSITLALALLTLASALPCNAESVEFRRADDRIDILVAGRPFTTYYVGPAAAKPYLYPLRTAGGTI